MHHLAHPRTGFPQPVQGEAAKNNAADKATAVMCLLSNFLILLHSFLFICRKLRPSYLIF